VPLQEYRADLVLPMSSVISVVEIDPISRSKKHCLQIIGEEKTYRFAAKDEEVLARCLGSFKSILAKRDGLPVPWRGGAGAGAGAGAGIGAGSGVGAGAAATAGPSQS
jgi:hypothetical protein